VTVYPARQEGDRWRAVWYEGGRRRQCESVSEYGLAARLAKVTERLTADAPGLELPGADLIAYYLSPSRHPAGRPWSRKHADTQSRLCRKYLAPVIASLRCEDIKVADMQAAVNNAPTPGEGDRLARCISALVTAGIDAGYLTNPRLRNTRWQPGDRPPPQPRTTTAGESALYVDQADIPAHTDVTALASALAYLHPDYEFMAYAADLPLTPRHLVAVIELRPPRPPPRSSAVLVAVRIGVTVPEPRLTTNTVFPSGVTAIA
jgi:hypothetical protein